MFDNLDSARISFWEKAWSKLTGKDKWASAIGIVRKVGAIRPRDHGRYYIITYAYSVGGTTYQGKFEHTSAWKCGDQVDVRYNPRKPSRSECTGYTKPISIGFALGFSALLIGLYLFLSQPVGIFHLRDFREGERIVQRVEAYRSAHGRLPESLEEVGVQSDRTTIYYQKTDAEGYEVSFGTWLGESEIYDSHTKKWH